jgi:hypothetical protein
MRKMSVQLEQDKESPEDMNCQAGFARAGADRNLRRANPPARRNTERKNGPDAADLYETDAL